MTEPQNIYSGIFFPNGLHMTWQFGEKCSLPKDVKEGDEGCVKLHSFFCNESIGFLQCSLPFVTDNNGEGYLQSDNRTPLHITLWTGRCEDGGIVTPKTSGDMLRSFCSGEECIQYNPYIQQFSLLTRGIVNEDGRPIDYEPYWHGKWGYFKK